MKSPSRLTRYLNACTSLLLCIQPNQNILIAAEDDKKEEYLQGNKEKSIEEDQRDLIGKNSDNKNLKNRLPRYIP